MVLPEFHQEKTRCAHWPEDRSSDGMGPDRWEQTEPVRVVDLDAVSNETLHFCAPAQLFVVVVVVVVVISYVFS